jgi:hypothetical protein
MLPKMRSLVCVLDNFFNEPPSKGLRSMIHLRVGRLERFSDRY